jgi:hypothetical protein
MKLLEDKFIIGGAMVLVGALIIAGSLVWYGTRSTAMGIGTPGTPPPQKLDRPADIPDPKTTYTQKMSEVVGTVASVGGGKLVVSQSVGGKTIEVIVDSNTRIYRHGAQKDEATYQKEMDAFIKSISYGEPEDQYYAPSRYELTKISFTDIKVEDTVYVKSQDDTSKDTIRASSIEVLAIPNLQ